MPWKMDEAGVVIVQDGNPVWVYDDGKEAGFNAESALRKIGELKGEAKDYRLKFKDSKDILKVLEDADIEIEGDKLGEFITKATEAIATVENLNEGDLVKAGEVEKVKQGVIESYEAKLVKVKDGYDKKIGDLESSISKKDLAIRKSLVESAFGGSEFIKEKTVLFPEIAYDYLGKHFVVEEVNGELVPFAVDKSGDKIFSIQNPGDYATPEEAIEILIMDHSKKDYMLKQDAKGTGATGNGAKNNGIKNPWAKETMNLTEQVRIANTNPTRAKELAAQAGVDLRI